MNIDLRLLLWDSKAKILAIFRLKFNCSITKQSYGENNMEQHGGRYHI